MTLANPDSSPAVEKVQGYFAEMLAMEAVVTLEDEGDVIFLRDDTLLETVGAEGYTLEASEERVLIKAATDTGLCTAVSPFARAFTQTAFSPWGRRWITPLTPFAPV